MFKFKDGTLKKAAYVVIDGVEHEVHMPEYEGETPMSAENLNLALQNSHPIGSMYTTTLEDNPCNELGFGEWEKRNVFHGGELIAYGTAYNQSNNTELIANGSKLDFSDTKIPNKKFNIKNFVDGVISDQDGTFRIATKGIVGIVKCNAKFCGLGGNGIVGLWWQGNSNALPSGINLLSTNSLLTGPYGETFGGSTNTLLYEVTDEASDETEFFVNPFVNPYGGSFIPCQAGVKCSLEVEVYSKKQTTYVWERVS